MTPAFVQPARAEDISAQHSRRLAQARAPSQAESEPTADRRRAHVSRTVVPIDLEERFEKNAEVEYKLPPFPLAGPPVRRPPCDTKLENEKFGSLEV